MSAEAAKKAVQRAKAPFLENTPRRNYKILEGIVKSVSSPTTLTPLLSNLTVPDSQMDIIGKSFDGLRLN